MRTAPPLPQTAVATSTHEPFTSRATSRMVFGLSEDRLVPETRIGVLNWAAPEVARSNEVMQRSPGPVGGRLAHGT